jgi:hypothetical protein
VIDYNLMKMYIMEWNLLLIFSKKI